MLYNCQAEYIDYEYCLNILHLPDFFFACVCIFPKIYFQICALKACLKIVSCITKNEFNILSQPKMFGFCTPSPFIYNIATDEFG